MAGGVDLPVAAPLLGLEPSDRGHLVRVGSAGGVEHRSHDGLPLRSVLGADNPPSRGLEPVHRRPCHHTRERTWIDAEVVPVDEEDEVRKAKTPGGVLRLMESAGREPSLALDDEDLHVLCSGKL